MLSFDGQSELRTKPKLLNLTKQKKFKNTAEVESEAPFLVTVININQVILDNEMILVNTTFVVH